MANKAIIDRIKKLLALAKNNTNTAEATAAALKAQKLIADNDVSKADLYQDEPENICEVVDETNIKGNPWAKRLASAIADNFRCRWYLSQDGTRDMWTGRVTTTNLSVVFMGYETDAEAARVTFDRLYEVGTKLANAEARRVRNETGSAYGVKNSFLLGYVSGIRKELEKQSVALVLIRPKAVDDYADDRTKGFRTSRSTVRNAGYDSAYDRGQTAGRDSVRSARMKGQAALTA